MKKSIAGLIGALALLTLVGCAGNTADTSGKIAGKITVITQRTDIVDTVFKQYAADFKKVYPDVDVTFEAIADYESQIKIRMSTKDYGDVLLLPTSVPIADLPSFFEPLGDLGDLSKQYVGLEERSVGGKVYGLPLAVNYSGVVYNKKVFADAGVKTIPKTPDEFIAALKAVKAKTKAIPLYTNYAAGWTLTQWEAPLTTVAGSVDYVNVKQVASDDNFVPGQPHYELYKVLYDVAKEGLIEKDPTTTDWEQSKADLAHGKIATMVLGCWAINQIKALTTTPDDIGFLPFPTKAEKVIVPLADDYLQGINVNSKNKAAARAWLDWFTNKSDYANVQSGGMSAVVGAELPAILKDYKALGVEFALQTPAIAGQEGWVDLIDKEAQIGLWQPDFKKRIVEAAIGNKKESYDDIMKDLNKAWVAARAKITAKK
jgi:raffinose/stachyose/melibiose transport system substrate-binding protein